MTFLQKTLPLLLLFLSHISLWSQDSKSVIDQYLQLVQREYSAKNAFETTKYVSTFWRQAGNPGFDSSIFKIQEQLEQAGYQQEREGLDAPLTYRIESYPLRKPSWSPQNATLSIVGTQDTILQFSENRNMIAINSFATPPEGVEAELVFLNSCKARDLADIDLRGKIVLANCHSYSLYKAAVEKRGAIGILSYYVPSYNQPKNYPNSIPFRSIPFNNALKPWGLNLSNRAYQELTEQLEKGPVRLNVTIETTFHPEDELTIIAEIKGTKTSEERFVFSAHVQEPGANDNASGVGTQAEMARTAAALFKAKKIAPDRTITFLWGDEIRSTRRYIKQDEQRAKGIRWGMSLDMVGEDTKQTGGTFLIEKMPDPSAIWTRGEDKHSEWGASPVKQSDFNPHHFNNIVEFICRRQGKLQSWTVNTNPYEGGSDHQPFLDAKIPGLLFWHFTDVFYHTDADRIDKVSPTTLKNVGVSALTTALFLCNSHTSTATTLLEIVEQAALKRLAAERALSQKVVSSGKPKEKEQEILKAWKNWYLKAIPTVADVLTNETPKSLQKQIKKSQKRIKDTAHVAIESLE